jgi:hypothetical protein
MVDSHTALIFIVALGLAALAAAGASVLRERVHPAVAYPALWATLLLLSLAALPLDFFRIEPAAVAVFVGGALLFVLGAGLGEQIAGQRRVLPVSPIDRLDFRVIAACAAVLNLVMLPVWWGEVTSISGANDLLTASFRMRWIQVLGLDRHGFVVGNWLVLGLIVAPILALGAFRQRLPGWWALLVCAPWVFCNLVSNGRAGTVQLIVCVLYLRATESRPLDWRTVLGGAALFLLVFGGGVLLVAKGDAAEATSALELLRAVVINLIEYVVQGPILFSRWFAGLTDVVSTWDALVFPCTLLQGVGLCTVGELHQEFAAYGTEFSQIGNVYTVYFASLPKYGWIGFAVLIAAYGAWATFHHRRHRQHGHLFHSLFAGQLFASTLLSGFSDTFAPSLNFLLKTALVCAVLQAYFIRREASLAPARGEPATP